MGNEADDIREAVEAEGGEAGRDAYTLDESLRGALRAAIEAGEVAVIDALMEPLHPADIADLLEQVSAGERAAWLVLWSRGIDGDVLSELDWGLREEVIGLLPPGVVARAVRELDSDDIVDILEDLDDDQAAALLDALDDRDRTAVEQALAYPEETAGRLMQREVVHAPEHWNVGEMIDYLRAHKTGLPEQFYHVILTDTGEVVEFCDPRIESIKKTIEEVFDIEINNHSLYFYGTRKDKEKAKD